MHSTTSGEGVPSPFFFKVTTMIQLDFFPLSKEEQLIEEIKKLRESNTKVRKKLFAQNSELTKMYLDLYNEFEQLKRSICHERRI